jgi:hypothetical protein
METNDLIKALAADRGRRTTSLSRAWTGALVLAAILAATVFFATIGPRPDIAAAAETVRFLFKFVLTAVLAMAAFFLVRELSRPGESWRAALPWLALPALLIAAAVVLELLVMPPETWQARLIGTNSRACLTYIPLFGLGPLALFLLAIRYGAPTHPAIAGAAAGLLAGGVAATFYAAHCTDDSPLFVATWYSIAILGLALLGAVGASRLARW